MKKGSLYFSIAFFTFILWVIYQANTNPHSSLFKSIKLFPNSDKLGHFILFGILTLSINLAFQFKSYRRVYLGTLIVSIFVLIEEATQYFIPTRTMSIIDLIADGVGITLATIITWKLENRAKRKNCT